MVQRNINHNSLAPKFHVTVAKNVVWSQEFCAPKLFMSAQPWTVHKGAAVPSGYPVQILVQRGDVELGRGPVKGGTVTIPAGSPGTAVVVYIKNVRDVTAIGGFQARAVGAWLKDTETMKPSELPVAFFSGLHPEYNLQLAEDRVRLITAIKAHAKKGGVTGGRLVPLFLTTASGIMAVIRKLADWNKLMARESGADTPGALTRTLRSI